MTTDHDTIFEKAELLCLLAVSDPALLPEYLEAQRKANSLEHSGWKKMTGKTQHQIVMDHIAKNGSISPHEAILDHGITRLAARVHELKERGHKIITEMKRNPSTGKTYARYSLAV